MREFNSPLPHHLKMEYQPPKGTRDLYGKDSKLREYLKDTIKSVFQKYGYQPLENPCFETISVLNKKTAGGSEINKEIFKFKDQGKRDLGLRFDLTVPLCRFISNNPQIKIPFKRYNIGEVFRDGPIKIGRYRQFTQADVDVVGVESSIAEAEILKLVNEVFNQLKINYTIKINSRVLANEILEYCSISEDKFEAVLLTLDKLEKIGNPQLIEELQIKRISKSSIDKLLDVLKTKNSLDQLSIIAPKGVAQLRNFVSFLELFKVQNYKFDITLARGLNYYTGTVFEVYSLDSNVKSSIAAGGRYDKLISSFTDNQLNYPAVGISFGIDPILEIIKDFKNKLIMTKVYIISISQLEPSIKLLNELRKNNINADIELLQRGIGKSLDYANRSDIPYVIFLGEKEVKNNKVKLRTMETGEEEFLTLEEVVK
ncbi:histidine--tRNA ligase, partial [Candidatus Woesearchaeota archaeon]|nr:histidine--tRNA ligase [Candidatus Woesearchaeota archaeon]